ncbi:hypothetical protein AVEN_272212-1 [Araneus ventricosus]|uniref:Uncharacterized protein n=1 Tax=Araneus ventricosus TaxID=182803 RepID=A0A4Y2SEM9_ARAVE|nr:hypothetical protein AVEN_272212-1 [Araneus ventricosus]
MNPIVTVREILERHMKQKSPVLSSSESNNEGACSRSLLNPIVKVWEIMERHVQQKSPVPSSSESYSEGTGNSVNVRATEVSCAVKFGGS